MLLQIIRIDMALLFHYTEALSTTNSQRIHNAQGEAMLIWRSRGPGTLAAVVACLAGRTKPDPAIDAPDNPERIPPPATQSRKNLFPNDPEDA